MPLLTELPRRAFTLIEILVAVGLMSLLILGLLSMFHQTQRAAHLGMAQVDVLEPGRVTLQFATDDLERISTSERVGVVNLVATNYNLRQPLFPFQPLFLIRSVGGSVRCQLQNIFFISRQNDQWIGTGYVVHAPVGGVGSLYRFTNSVALSQNPDNLYFGFQSNLVKFANFHRVADRVISFQFYPYDRQGNFLTNFVNANSGEFMFLHTNLPAYLDLELAVLDPKPYDKFRSLTNTPGPGALNFLVKQIDHVNLFLRRIPVRSGL
jgi:prepilin-type N-terminal cleavage/methylation domain-containing protein